MSWKGQKRTIRCSSYTAEAMRLAYLSVKSGQNTGRKAAAMFKVPYGTLNKKLSGRAPVEAHGAGRPIEISVDSENKFAEYLKIAGKYGYGYNNCEIKDLVGEFVKKECIKTRWQDGKPGYQWLKNFLKRHPEIKVRKEKKLANKSLKGVDPFVVNQFYEDLKDLYGNEKITDVDGYRVYNACEILFRNNCQESWTLPSRCEKCVSKIAVELDTSVVVSVRADGKKLHPLIMFQGRCALPSCMANGKAPGSTYYTASTRKWRKETLFSYWFENVFIPQIPNKEARSGKSVVLLFDGSSLQVSMSCLAEAVRHNVILVRLPAKLNKHLQPLSRTCLSVLQSVWDDQLVAWKGESLATIQKLFGQLLGMAWNQHFGKRIVRKAFQSTGVFPSDKDRFPANVFSQVVLKKYLKGDRVTVRNRRVKVEKKDEPMKKPVKVSNSEEIIVPDQIDQSPSFSKVTNPNLFERFTFRKRSNSVILDLSKRNKSSDISEKESTAEIKQEV